MDRPQYSRSQTIRQYGKAMDIKMNCVSEIIKQLQVMKATVLTTYKEWAVYKSHIVVSLLVVPLFFLVQLFIWRAVYTTNNDIKGFDIEQMLLYYGVVAIINSLTYDYADWDLQMLIRTGKFSTFMLRPVSHLYYAFCQKIGHRVLASWLEFTPVLLVFYFIFRIDLMPVYPVWTIVSIFLSFILVFLLNYCIGLTGFWFTKTEGIRRAFMIFRGVFSGSFIPLTFFPQSFQVVLFLLPFQFITYAPVRIFMGNYELAGIKLSIPEVIGFQLLSAVVMLVVNRCLWRLGIRKYTGVGV